MNTTREQLRREKDELSRALNDQMIPGVPDSEEITVLRKRIAAIDEQLRTMKDRPPLAPLETAYLRRLFEQAGIVTLAGIDRKAKDADNCLNLSAIYTALLTHSTELRPGKSPTRELYDREQTSALEQVNRHRRLVLLGEPGSGKSTFVNFLALCLCGELLNEPAPIPSQEGNMNCANLELLTAPLPNDDGKDGDERQAWTLDAPFPARIILRDFAARGLPEPHKQASAEHFWAFVRAELSAAALGEYADALKSRLLTGGGLILFDGLDEVPDADERRAQIKQVVEDVARVFARCRIVVTSRTYAYQQQNWKLTGFVESVLAPFTEGQIRRFAHYWYAHIAQREPLDAERWEQSLTQAIFDPYRRLDELAERPLLLTLMACAHWHGGKLPDKREELYHETVELLFHRWEGRKPFNDQMRHESLSELLRVGPERVRSALNQIAFEAHKGQAKLTGTADIAESDLVTELMAIREDNNLRPAQLIEYLNDRAGLLVPRGVKVYAFPHRTFQEYLAACYLTDPAGDYPYQIAELARNEPNRWREAALLAGAKAARGTEASLWQLVDALCGDDAPTHSPSQKGMSVRSEDAYGALLAGQALAETANLQQIHPRNQNKLARVRGWLKALMRSDALPALERANAGNAFAALGDDRPGVTIAGLLTPPGGEGESAWIEIPAGSFMMGSDEYKSEQPRHCVAFREPFWISRFPITNAQFRAFIKDGGYAERAYWTEKGWAWRERRGVTEPHWAGGVFDLDNHPVVGVSWFEATAFCAWLTAKMTPPQPSPQSGEGVSVFPSPKLGEGAGGVVARLPSEAEWEYAARGKPTPSPSEEGSNTPPPAPPQQGGGSNTPPQPSPQSGEGVSVSPSPDLGEGGGGEVHSPSPESGEEGEGEVKGRVYPWRGDITPEHANYDDTKIGATSAVGCFPRGASAFGVEEMAGNVWEWQSDAWHENYDGAPNDGSVWDNLGDEKTKVLRGGSWDSDSTYCRSAHRGCHSPDNRYYFIGVRVLARTH